jgi:hypothetical protein
MPDPVLPGPGNRQELKMKIPGKIQEKLNALSTRGNVYLCGSTAVCHYHNTPVKAWRIIADCNLADAASVIKGIEYPSDLASEAVVNVTGGHTLYLTFYEHSTAQNEYDYIRSAALQPGLQPGLSFVFSVSGKRYIALESSYTDVKSGIYPTFFNQTIEMEFLLDTAYCHAMVDMEPGSILLPKSIQYQIPDAKSMLHHVLTSNSPWRALTYLEECGVLSMLFPFLDDLRGVEQDRILHPEGDAFDHTIECFKHVRAPSLQLAWGLLLHDIGKGIEKKRKGFREHASDGAWQVKPVLNKWNYDISFIEDISYLVEHHMVNSYFHRLSNQMVIEMFNSDLGQDLMKLYKADTMGSIGKLDAYTEIISLLKRNKRVSSFK